MECIFFVIGPTLATAISDNFEEILKNEALSAIFCPGGLPLEAGATLKYPSRFAQELKRGGDGEVRGFRDFGGEMSGVVGDQPVRLRFDGGGEDRGIVLRWVQQQEPRTAEKADRPVTVRQ